MSDELIARTLDVIAKAQHLPRETVTIEKSFEDLNIDSLDAMNLVFAVETEFDISIPDEEMASIRSVREMVEGIAKLVAVEPAS